MKIPFTSIEFRSPFVKAAGEIPASLPNKPSRRSDSDLGGRSVDADPMGDWFLNLPDKLAPKQVSAIMRQALAGNLWQQYQLIQRMRDSWPEFRKCEFELRSAIANSRFIVQPYCAPNQEPTPSALEKADLVQRALDSFAPDRFEEEEGKRGLVYDIADGITNGVAICELLWDENAKDPNGNREKMIRASAWVHPRHYSFRPDGSIGVAPSEAASTLSFPSQAKDIPLLDNPSKFIVAKFKSKSGTCLGAGLARVLMPIWVSVVYGWDFMLTFSQKYGNAFLDIAYTPGISQAEVDRFEQLAKLAQNQSYIVHPNNGEIKITPAQGLSGESAHVQLRRMADSFAQKVFLGQTLTSSTPDNTGSMGQGLVHQDVRAELIEGHLKWVAEILTTQYARSLVIENFGEGTEIPTVIPDLTRPLSITEQTQLLSAVSISTIPLPKKEVYAKLGLSIPKPGDEVLIRGVPTILEEPLTETDRKERDFEQQLGQQVKMAEVGQELQGGEPVQGSVPKILAKASKNELEELEGLVLAAERAPHRNGEVKALKKALDRIGGRK